MLNVGDAIMCQVRTLLQQRLCRTVPLEAIGDMTVASLRALAEEAGQGELRHCSCFLCRCGEAQHTRRRSH